MSICTPDDIRIPADLRQRLTDDEDVGIEDTVNIQECCDEADATFYRYVGQRDATPLVEPYTAECVQVCRKITVFEMWERLNMVPTPEKVKEAYEEIIRFLEAYAKGNGSLGIEETPESGGGDPVASFPDDEFSLNGY